MDKIKRFLDPSTKQILLASEFNTTHSDSRVHISDRRLAQLMLVLRELDESVAGLEELPQTELSELISSAILACGFTDGTEEQHAIAAVLEAIERGDPMRGSS